MKKNYENRVDKVTIVIGSEDFVVTKEFADAIRTLCIAKGIQTTTQPEEPKPEAEPKTKSSKTTKKAASETKSQPKPKQDAPKKTKSSSTAPKGMKPASDWDATPEQLRTEGTKVLIHGVPKTAYAVMARTAEDTFGVKYDPAIKGWKFKLRKQATQFYELVKHISADDRNAVMASKGSH